MKNLYFVAIDFVSKVAIGCLLVFLPKSLFATAREYFVYQPQAYNIFVQPVDGRYNSFEDWAMKKNIKYESYNKEFCPDKNNLLWVYYRSPDNLRVWFRVVDTNEQKKAIDVLNTLLERPSIKPYRKYAIINPVTFVEGNCLLPGKMEDVVLVVNLAKKQSDGALTKLENPAAKLAAMQDMAQKLKTQIDKLLPGEIDKIRKAHGLDKIPSPGEDFTNFDFSGDPNLQAPEGEEEQRKEGDEEGSVVPGTGDGKTENNGTIGTKPDKPGRKADSDSKADEHGTDNAKPGKPGSKVDANGNVGNGKATKGGGGKGVGIGGGLPDVGFARWFQTLAKVLADYFGIRGLCEQWLMIAYAIAPELFEQVGSFLAKLQHLTAPKSLEDFLDAAADIYNKLEQYLHYFVQAYRLLSSGDFQSLMKDIESMKASDVLNKVQKANVLPANVNKMLGATTGFNFDMKDLKGLTDQQIKTRLSGIAKQKMRSLAEQKVKSLITKNAQKIANKLPVRIDVNGLYDCARKGDCKKHMEDEAKSIMNQTLPVQLRPYIEDVVKGDYSKAGRRMAYDQIKKHSGIDPSIIGPVFDFLKNNDVYGAIKAVGKSQLYRFGAYQDIAARIMDGQMPTDKQSLDLAAKAMAVFLENAGHPDAAKAVARYGARAVEGVLKGNIRREIKNALTNNSLSADVINAFLYKNGEKAVEKLKDYTAIQFGFSDYSARKALLAGHLEEAVRLQSQTGRWGENTLKKNAQDFKQVVSNRATLTQYLVKMVNIDPRYADEVALRIRTFRK